MTSFKRNAHYVIDPFPKPILKLKTFEDSIGSKSSSPTSNQSNSTKLQIRFMDQVLVSQRVDSKISQHYLSSNLYRSKSEITHKNKLFKLAALYVRAAVRFSRAGHNSEWAKNMKRIQKSLGLVYKYELVQSKNIATWCCAITARPLSSIKEDVLDFLTNNSDNIKVDMACVKICNAVLFMFENLAQFTQSNYLVQELRPKMQIQIAKATRTLTNPFVNSRTFFLNDQNRKLDDQQLQMVLAEVVLMETIIPYLLKQQEYKLPILQKMLASVLNTVYCQYFKQLPIVHTDILSIQKIVRTKDNMYEINNTNVINLDILYEGLYTAQELEPMFKLKTKLKTQINKLFFIILNNLCDNLQLI